MTSHRLSLLGKVTLYTLLLLCAFVFVAPFIWMISTSLKTLPETTAMPIQWIPSSLEWRNYPDAIEAMGDFWLYAWNSLYICVITVIGTVLSSALAAYGFSRIEWRGRDKVFLLVLATMMIPFPVIMVPVYGLFKDLGWVGSFKPLWVPALFANAFSVFLLRQFFKTIPNELSDAARIDGCNELRIFWHIVLPLSKASLATVALFTFMWTWNDYLGPMVYLINEEQFTLSLALQSFVDPSGGKGLNMWHHLMAASTLITLPLVILYFFCQKVFVQGINATGTKG